MPGICNCIEDKHDSKAQDDFDFSCRPEDFSELEVFLSLGYATKSLSPSACRP